MKMKDYEGIGKWTCSRSPMQHRIIVYTTSATLSHISLFIQPIVLVSLVSLSIVKYTVCLYTGTFNYVEYCIYCTCTFIRVLECQRGVTLLPGSCSSFFNIFVEIYLSTSTNRFIQLHNPSHQH